MSSSGAAAAATRAAVTAAASRTHPLTGAKTGTRKGVSDSKCQGVGFNSISKSVCVNEESDFVLFHLEQFLLW